MIKRYRDGWTAHNERYAVWARTKEEALRRYYLATGSAPHDQTPPDPLEAIREDVDVLERRRAREQVKGLEDEADFAVADLGPLVPAQPRHVGAV